MIRFGDNFCSIRSYDPNQLRINPRRRILVQLKIGKRGQAPIPDISGIRFKLRIVISTAVFYILERFKCGRRIFPKLLLQSLVLFFIRSYIIHPFALTFNISFAMLCHLKMLLIRVTKGKPLVTLIFL